MNFGEESFVSTNTTLLALERKSQAELNVIAAEYLCKHISEDECFQALIRSGATDEEAMTAIQAFRIGTRKACAALSIEIECIRGMLEATDMARCAAEEHNTTLRIKASELKLKWLKELAKQRNNGQTRNIRKVNR